MLMLMLGRRFWQSIPFSLHFPSSLLSSLIFFFAREWRFLQSIISLLFLFSFPSSLFGFHAGGVINHTQSGLLLFNDTGFFKAQDQSLLHILATSNNVAIISRNSTGDTISQPQLYHPTF